MVHKDTLLAETYAAGRASAFSLPLAPARVGTFREALQERGFAVKRCIGDGNCLLAVADQVAGDQDRHPEYRRLAQRTMCVDWLDCAANIVGVDPPQ